MQDNTEAGETVEFDTNLVCGNCVYILVWYCGLVLLVYNKQICKLRGKTRKQQHYHTTSLLLKFHFLA